MRQTIHHILILTSVLVLNGGCGDSGESTEAQAPTAMMTTTPGMMATPPASMSTPSDRSEVNATQPSEPSPDNQNVGMTGSMPTNGANPSEMNRAPTNDGPRKKGIAMTHGTYDWSYAISSLKPFWSYSWGITLSRFQPDGIEFVPMQWTGSMNDETATKLRDQIAAGDIKYLLGYNEPDSETQANMTVDKAIMLWSQLEALDIPLVSPSPVHFDNEWTEAFMERALAEGLRIDYLGYHSYGGTNPQWLLDKLDALYERYQIPIWITEFAVADWNAETRESNRVKPEDVLAFMQTILPELDRRDHIFRYAWYTDFSSRQLWPSALFDGDRNLTPLGEFYAQHTPNPSTGAPKPYPEPPADPDNLLTNGGFELGSREGWDGYENRIIDIDNSEPHMGAFSGMLRGGYSSALSQNLDLQAGVTYRITVHSRWSESPGRSTGAVIEEVDTKEKISAELPESTEWEKTSFTVTPTETKEYAFWIWTGPGTAANLHLDTISIRTE